MMKHYFTLSMHLVLGLLIIILILLLWKSSAWAPQGVHEVPQNTPTSESAY